MSKKRVPNATPDAPRVRSAATCAPVVIPPAATTGGHGSWDLPAGWSVFPELRVRSWRISGTKARMGGADPLPWPPASLPT